MENIGEIVEEYIKESAFRPGDRLPPETQMANDLKMTRHQLRKGIELLKKQHKVRQIRGSGTYIEKRIAPKAPKEKIISFVTPVDPLVMDTIDQFQQAFTDGKDNGCQDN